MMLIINFGNFRLLDYRLEIYIQYKIEHETVPTISIKRNDTKRMQHEIETFGLYIEQF